MTSDFPHPSFSLVEYLDLVDSEEKREIEEMSARQDLNKGERKATVVLQLLEKLSKPAQMPFYYCGGLEVLSQIVTDCEYSFFLSLSVHFFLQ